VYDVLAERYSTIRLPVVSKADSTIRAVLLQSKFTECSKELLENAIAPMNTTVPGMSMLVRAVDWKADAPMLTMAGLEANVTTDSEVAPLKELAGKSVTPAGTAMAVRPEPENASLPMVVSKEPVANVTVVNADKSLKASTAMLATLTPSEIETSPVVWNCTPMLVISLSSGNDTAVNALHP